MRNWNYILLLFLLILPTMCSCSDRKIEIGQIERRTQLDSIIGLLSPDSVRIDSLINRTLNISLTGNFTAFGTPVHQVSFKLINEELDEMNIYSFPKGALSLLNNIENTYGLATYGDTQFSWELPNRDIYLQAESGQFFKKVQPLHMNDSLGGKLSVTFYSFEQNKITDIAKEYKPKENFMEYKIFASLYSSLKYKLWLNDFPIIDEDMRLNKMIPIKGKQTITIEFSPSEELQEVKNMIAQNRGSMSIDILEYSANKQKKTSLAITEDMLVAGKKNILTPDLLEIPYILDYVDGKDLRTIDGLKEKIYAYYKSLHDAYTNGNKMKLIELRYPLEKQSAMALNRSEKDLQALWRFEKSVLADNEGFDLMPIENLKIEFAYNGKLARLIPINPQKDQFALTAYIPDLEPYSMAYYVYLDKTNQLNFAIE